MLAACRAFPRCELLRSDEVADATFNAATRSAVAEVVGRQRDAGVTMPSDGEQSKISYATYTTGRLEGFEIQRREGIPSGPDVAESPGFAAISEALPTRPVCVGPVSYGSHDALEHDLANLRSALRDGEEAFMTAPSPGTIAFFQDNDYYDSTEAFLEAAGEGSASSTKPSWRQGSSCRSTPPRFRSARSIPFLASATPRRSRCASTHSITRLRNVPSERVRMHLCWGKHAGPHHYDVPARSCSRTSSART